MSKLPDVPAPRATGSIIRSAASLLIYSGTLSPDDISSQLQLSPTRTTAKGIKIGKRTGVATRVPNNLWVLSSESHEASLEFGRHLDWLLEKLGPAQIPLRAIANRADTNMYCFGVIWTEEKGVDVEISLSQLQRLVELGLRLQVQFADYGSTE